MRVILSEEMRRQSKLERANGNEETGRLLLVGALAIEELQRGMDDVIGCCKRVRNQEVSVDRKDGGECANQQTR
jgi:hypothetical protein